MIPSSDVYSRGVWFTVVFPLYADGERPRRSLPPPVPVSYVSWTKGGRRVNFKLAVLRAVTDQPSTARAIAQRMGCPTHDTSTALGKLWLRGQVIREGQWSRFTYRKVEAA